MVDNLTTRGSIGFGSLDTDLALIQRLPEYLQNWILFESPVSLDVADILSEHERRMIPDAYSFLSDAPSRDSNSVWREIASDLKRIYHHKESRSFYGPDYPFTTPKSWVRRPLDSRPRRVVR